MTLFNYYIQKYVLCYCLSLNHMAYHVSHTKYQNVDLTFCQCVHVRQWSHLFTTMQAQKSCQFVQKRCREKERKENKKICQDNSKAYCVTLQRNKDNLIICKI